MVHFLARIRADKLRVVEKLADRFLVGEIHKRTDEGEYDKLGNAYKEVILFARDTLDSDQFNNITFYNHELKVITIKKNTPRKYSYRLVKA